MAFEQLGDREQEYACLTEACPLLEAGWGPEHPRAAAARKHFEELKKTVTPADCEAVRLMLSKEQISTKRGDK